VGLLIEQERRAWRRQPQVALRPAAAYARGLELLVNAADNGYDSKSRAFGVNAGSTTCAGKNGVGFRSTSGANQGLHWPVPAITGSSRFSILVYVTVNDGDAAGALGIAQVADTTASSGGPQILIQRNGTQLRVYEPNASYSLNEAGVMLQGTTHCIVITFDGATKRLFRNGAERASVATGYLGANPAGRLWLGNGYAASAGCDIYAGAYWSRALTPIEATALSANPWALFAPRRTRRYIQLAGGASSYSITLTASTSAVAAIVKAAKLQRQANASAAAAIGKAAASSKAATATTTGQVKRAVSITRRATTALSAAVATIKAKLLTLAATVSSSASVRRAVSITRSGTATSSASVRRAVAVVRSAASAAAAAVVKRTSSIKSATTTASGAISSLKAKLLTLVATVSTAASLTKGVRITRAAVSTVAALISRLFIAGTGGPPVFIPALRRLISASRGVLFTSPDRSVDLESPDRTNTLTSPRRDDT